MSRSLAIEGDGLLGVVRMAAVNHEARYYMLRKARYPENRTEDVQHRDLEVVLFTSWVFSRNEASALDVNGYPYSPTSRRMELSLIHFEQILRTRVTRKKSY